MLTCTQGDRPMKIETFTEASEQVFDTLMHFENSLFDDPYTREAFERDVPRKAGFALFVATVEGQIAGYKAGYEVNAHLYYSWLGGVLPEYRGQGLAKALMKAQHDWLKEQGYKTVRTYTENKYRSMLILNIKQGFDVIGVYKSDHDEKQTIMLEKLL